ncbi:hypothetical protein R1flu_019030 [Riccia fluitans]|uniref:Secreted protein n=1 Tax=Riccia fluitans TaxID=41844 RepID=A0ABD1ZIJ7_9MARC
MRWAAAVIFRRIGFGCLVSLSSLKVPEGLAAADYLGPGIGVGRGEGCQTDEWQQCTRDRRTNDSFQERKKEDLRTPSIYVSVGGELYCCFCHLRFRLRLRTGMRMEELQQGSSRQGWALTPEVKKADNFCFRDAYRQAEDQVWR